MERRALGKNLSAIARDRTRGSKVGTTTKGDKGAARGCDTISDEILYKNKQDLNKGGVLDKSPNAKARLQDTSEGKERRW